MRILVGIQVGKRRDCLTNLNTYCFVSCLFVGSNFWIFTKIQKFAGKPLDKNGEWWHNVRATNETDNHLSKTIGAPVSSRYRMYAVGHVNVAPLRDHFSESLSSSQGSVRLVTWYNAEMAAREGGKREILEVKKLPAKPLDKLSRMCDTTTAEGNERKRWKRRRCPFRKQPGERSSFQG